MQAHVGQLRFILFVFIKESKINSCTYALTIAELWHIVIDSWQNVGKFPAVTGKKTTFQWDIKINFRDIGPRLRWKIYREWNVNSGKNLVPSSTKAALNSGCFMLHWLFIVH